MGRIGFSELVVVLLIVVVLFGAKRIPEILRSMGQGVKEFKDAIDGKKDENQK
jgi:sec-independent protein translocase protein TatA